MPPFWVVKRELLRVLDYAKFPFLAAISPIRRRLHDRDKGRTNRITPGAQPRGPNVVLFLLFQPKGVLASTFETCRHFAEKGFGCLIVSNVALSDKDRAALAPYCFEMLERRNFGYDFGGYRDGILHLLDGGVQIDKLLIMNDSVWFPTFADEDFLDHVLTQTTDLYGAVMSQRKSRVTDRYVQSYAFAFNGKIVQSPAFATYWRGLSVQSNRQWTIRQCERKMSLYFRLHGFSNGARWDFDDVAAAISRLGDDDLVALLQLEAKMGRKRALVIASLIGRRGEPSWRTEVETYVRSADFRKYILLLHPAALAEMNFPFLKKSFEQHTALLRPIYAQVLQDRCTPIMLAEIANWDR